MMVRIIPAWNLFIIGSVSGLEGIKKKKKKSIGTNYRLAIYHRWNRNNEYTFISFRLYVSAIQAFTCNVLCDCIGPTRHRCDE